MRTHPHLYEISAWPWLERLSSDAGVHVTLENVPAATWDGLAAQGIDCVYLMGVWQRSGIGRLMARTEPALFTEYDRVLPGWGMRDVPGSPYAIQAYEPDARMGGWRGLDAAHRALADRGVTLMLDFVPNHLGFDHAWIRSHPDRFVQGTLDNYRADPALFHPHEGADGSIHFLACGRDPFFPPWRDVAQLNYYNPETRAAMIDTLRTIAAHCDGVRCDMAMLVLNDVFAQTWQERVDLLWGRPDREFWPEATARVPMIYLAEVYWDREYELQQQGFDYTYDKRLLDRLHGEDSAGVRGHLQADAAYSARLARFLENHDEPRSAAAFGDRLRAAAALTFTLPGLRFFFDEQFSGASLRAPVQLGRWPPPPDRPDIRDLYSRLLNAIDDPLFHDGTWSLLEVDPADGGTSADLIACAWRTDAALAIVVVNVTGRTAEGRVATGPLPAAAVLVEDRLSGQTHRWSRDDLEKGLYVRLAPGGAHVFLCHAA